MPVPANETTGTTSGGRARPTQHLTLTAALCSGPDQSAAHGLVRPFDSVLFVYAGLAPLGEQERRLRWRRLAGALEEQGAPDAAVDILAARFAAAQEAPAVLALFAAADGTLVHEGQLHGVDMPDRAGFGAPAVVLPLLAWAQNRPPYVLVVSDRAGADLTASAGGEGPVRTWSVAGPDNEIERNAPGGWSQPRYQQRAEDSWVNNAARIAEEVTAAVVAVGAQVMLLSGDVRAVQLLTDQLPTETGLLVCQISGGRSPDGSQSGRANLVEHALRDAAAAQTRQILDQFREHLDPGGLSVEGSADTVTALAEGRVATLLVSDSPDETRYAWFGSDATDIFVDHESALSAQLPIRSGPLIDVAVRSALLSSGRVRVVPAGTAGEPIGGIGAICRYRSR